VICPRLATKRSVIRRRIVSAEEHDNGRTEVFRLTEHVAAEAPPSADQAASGGTKVVIYYSGENGQKVAHFFKDVSK
jgi:hypothetical protein